MTAPVGDAISVSSFATESGNDYLTVNGVPFSGTGSGLDTLEITDASITWDTDSSVTDSGWEICLVSAPIDVTQGTCGVTGNCVSSPNFGTGDYNNNDSCSITVPMGSLISVTAMDVECGFDDLTVNGVDYDCTTGPDGVVITDTTITWSTDGSIAKPGWQICLLAPFTTEPGPCVVSYNCVSSPNFGTSDYNNNDQCILTVPVNGEVIEVISFQTESDYDTLTVNGQPFSGNGDGLDGLVLSNPTIIWDSDGSVTSSGWQICVVEAPSSSPSSPPSRSPSTSPSSSPSQEPSSSPTSPPSVSPSSQPSSSLVPSASPTKFVEVVLAGLLARCDCKEFKGGASTSNCKNNYMEKIELGNWKKDKILDEYEEICVSRGVCSSKPAIQLSQILDICGGCPKKRLRCNGWCRDCVDDKIKLLLDFDIVTKWGRKQLTERFEKGCGIS